MQPDPVPLDALHSEGDLNLSPRRAAWTRDHLDAPTRALIEEDARYFLHQSLSTPCLNALSECRGTGFTDLQGRAFLDFHGNNVHQVGFGHPHVIDAVTRQMRQLPFCPRRYTNPTAVAFARKLTGLAPGRLNRLLLAPGGTSAIGMALKLARAVTGRFKTVSMWDAFHGASLDAISVGGEAIFRNGIGPLLPGCEHVPPPDPRRCPFKCGDACNLNCADYIEYVLEKEGDVAAVIGETVRCVPFIPPADYWKRIRAACNRHGTLLILDEIPICLGRTGRMFACEHFGIEPDLLVAGKGLGGGLVPLAALLAPEDFNDAMGRGALGHYTHEKSPVACAAGLATLEVIEQEGLLERATTLGRHALDRLRDLQRRHSLIGEVRGIGLLLGVELLRPESPRLRASDEADEVLYRCLARGLNFKVTMGNVLTLTPALTISREELDRAIDILDVAIGEVECGRPSRPVPGPDRPD